MREKISVFLKSTNMNFTVILLAGASALLAFLGSLYLALDASSAAKAGREAFASLSAIQTTIVDLRSPFSQSDRPPSQQIAPSEFRAHVIFEYERVRVAIKELELESSEAWKAFDAIWQKIRNDKDPSAHRLSLTDATTKLARVINEKLAESGDIISNVALIARIFALMGLLGSGAVLFLHWHQRKSLISSSPLPSFENNQNQQSKSLVTLGTALKEPLATLRTNIENAQAALEASTKALAVPVEATLFDNPLHYEKAESASKKVGEALRMLETVQRQQEHICEITNSLSHLGGESAPKLDLSTEDVLAAAVDAVSPSAEDDGVAVDYVVRSEIPHGSFNSEALNIVLSNIMLKSVESVKTSRAEDKRLLVSLWTASAFWQRFSPAEVLPDVVLSRFGRDTAGALSANGFVLLLTDSTGVCAFDDRILEQVSDVDTENIRNDSGFEFIRDIIETNGGYLWMSPMQVEPEMPARHLGVFWPL